MPALVAICLAAGGLGCGAGEDDGGGDRAAEGSDPGPKAPSKRDYIVQADTICANAEQAIETEAEIALGVGAADFTVAQQGVNDILESALTEAQLSVVQEQPGVASAVGVLLGTD